MLASGSVERSMRPTMPHSGAKPKRPATLPAALAAVLLLATTVDRGLAEPLRLLAEVGARDTTDGHISP